jgi:hypothetical protein
MPIRIIQDESQAEEQQPSIAVSAKKSAGRSAEGVKEPSSLGIPVQATWAMVRCQCTSTNRSYQLAFRQERDTFVLKSIDRAVAPTTPKDMGDVKGPFDWSTFVCPECNRGWTKGGKAEPVWPVILCSCRSLFCTSRGLRSKKGRAKDEWWWHCPKCGIDALAKVGIDSLDGQGIKGK